MKKTWIAAGSLTVIAAMAFAVPAVRGLAIELYPERKGADCVKLVDELTGAINGLQPGLAAVPAQPDSGVVNGLPEKVLELIDLGCLPAPELSDAAPAKNAEQQQTPRPSIPPMPSMPPMPSLSPLPSGLPQPSGSAQVPAGGELRAVPVCTDLTADLLHAVTGLLAALLSTDAPDVEDANSALTAASDTLMKLTDEANKCVPAKQSAAKR